MVFTTVYFPFPHREVRRDLKNIIQFMRLHHKGTFAMTYCLRLLGKRNNVMRIHIF